MTQEHFKKCPSCQNFIPEPATVCMYCGAGQQVQKQKKKGGLGKILLWLVVAFFSCIVLAVVGSFFMDETQPASSPSSSLGQVASVPTFTPTPAPAAVPTDTPEPPTPTPAPIVGQDVLVKEVRWKILEAQDLGQELTSNSQFIDSKRTTGKFVRVRFEIENRATDMASFGGGAATRWAGARV